MNSHDTLIKRCKLLLYSISDKEAVIPIKDLNLYMGINRYKEECIDKLLELLDKETPMKPIITSSIPLCPRCHEETVMSTDYSMKKYGRCINEECGQKLDWSDED